MLVFEWNFCKKYAKNKAIPNSWNGNEIIKTFQLDFLFSQGSIYYFPQVIGLFNHGIIE